MREVEHQNEKQKGRLDEWNTLQSRLPRLRRQLGRNVLIARGSLRDPPPPPPPPPISYLDYRKGYPPPPPPLPPPLVFGLSQGPHLLVFGQSEIRPCHVRISTSISDDEYEDLCLIIDPMARSHTGLTFI